MTDRRTSPNPEHFELQILLFVNSNLWELSDVNRIISLPLYNQSKFSLFTLYFVAFNFNIFSYDL